MRDTFRFRLSPEPDAEAPESYSFMAKPARYTVQAVEGDTLTMSAWNAWSGGVTQNPTTGENSRGWLNTYRICSPALTTPDKTVLVGSGRWDNVTDAYKNANPYAFDVQSYTVVTFYILDEQNHDNVGGLTLEVTRTDIPASKT